MSSEPAGRPGKAAGLDIPSAILAGLASLAIAGAAWHRWGRGEAKAEPPTVGAKAPILFLTDPETRRPVFVEPRRGRILWVTFWSPAAGPARPVIERLDRVWRRLRAREPFALLLVVPADAPADDWRPTLADASPDLPVFLSTAASRAAYAPGPGPLHFLIDEDGRIVATAAGLGDYLERLAEKAADLLDAIAPTEPRFAAGRRPGTGPAPPSMIGTMRRWPRHRIRRREGLGPGMGLSIVRNIHWDRTTTRCPGLIGGTSLR